MRNNIYLMFLLTIIPSQTAAWVQYKSDLNGKGLIWFKQPVHYIADSSGCSDLEDGSEFTAIEKSFNTWNNVECDSSKYNISDPVDTVNDGLIESGVVGKTDYNLIIFIKNKSIWLKNKDSNIIALTTLTYVRETGEIVDADIEVNDWKFKFTTSDTEEETSVDIENTITHEIGHLLGLDHSKDPESTMYYNAPNGELKKRTLEEDDIDGICTIYESAPVNNNGDDPSTDGVNDNISGDGGGGCNIVTENYNGWQIFILLLGFAMIIHTLLLTNCYTNCMIKLLSRWRKK